MMEQATNNAVVTTPPQGTFTHKIGKTTYVVGVHFSKTSKETIEDKIRRLILSDCENIVNNVKSD